MQEPYGLFGAINPTGHASVYLSRVCAETPVVLRRCDPGEFGIVISRYRKVSGYDWIAIPLIPYLYAVEDFASIPAEANAETVAYLRDEYRRKHLLDVVPDRPGGQTPKGSWTELIGAAYNRKIYGFQIETTEAQDQYLISVLNSRKNKRHFNLFFNNCADFSRGILNLYYAGAIRRNYIGDAGHHHAPADRKILDFVCKAPSGLSSFGLFPSADIRQPSPEPPGGWCFCSLGEV